MPLTNDKLNRMKVPQLQAECVKAGLSKAGNGNALRKRLRTWLFGPREPVAKRHKTSIEDDLLCPITRELPFDPVMAEDGCIYEREAIQKHFDTQAVGQVKSPMTNEPMGTNLFAATRIKTHIDTLIEEKIITGDSVEKWKQRIEEREKMESLLKKADQGDSAAMYRVGLAYYDGSRGFRKDDKLARKWFQRAHEAGSVKATTLLGISWLQGRINVPKDDRKAIMFLTEAATKGANLAAYALGRALYQGDHGMSVDKKEAARWLKVAVDESSPYDQIVESSRNHAQEMLDEMLENQN